MLTSSKVSLIIADDHPIFRNGLKDALKSVGFISKISTACNGEEVVEILEKNHHDVILMDIRMSPLDGFETTSIISCRFPDSRVIALTMSEDEHSVIQMIQNGAFGYLVKNADRDEILAAIKNVQQGKKHFSNEVSFLLAKRIMPTEKPLLNLECSEFENERARDVLYLVSLELSNNEIAELMCLSVRTVEYHRKRATLLTNSRNYIGVIKFAIKSGIMEDKALELKWKTALEKLQKRMA